MEVSHVGRCGSVAIGFIPISKPEVLAVGPALGLLLGHDHLPEPLAFSMRRCELIFNLFGHLSLAKLCSEIFKVISLELSN